MRSSIKVKWAACIQTLCACLLSSGRSPIRRQFLISCVHFVLSSLTLQTGVTAIEEVDWRWTGNNIVSFHEECSSYSSQGIDLYIFCAKNPLDSNHLFN